MLLELLFAVFLITQTTANQAEDATGLSTVNGSTRPTSPADSTALVDSAEADSTEPTSGKGGSTNNHDATEPLSPVGTPTVTDASRMVDKTGDTDVGRKPFIEADLSRSSGDSGSVDKTLGISRGRFEFGSYGRVGLTSNTDGEPAQYTNIVSHGPRLEESPYIELDLRYVKKFADGVTGTVLVTPAFFDFLFHYTGVWDASVALRNANFEADFH